jgi:hypothetical protein
MRHLYLRGAQAIKADLDQLRARVGEMTGEVAG